MFITVKIFDDLRNGYDYYFEPKYIVIFRNYQLSDSNTNRPLLWGSVLITSRQLIQGRFLMILTGESLSDRWAIN